MKGYKDTFQRERHAETLYSARTILAHVLELLPPIRSAVDVGCGVGTWLSVLRERGVNRVLGIDGKWVNQQLLMIPRECFQERDLGENFSVNERFDLAISLEVAEHLPPARASSFVESLTALSDVVLFSAAIPYQGGSQHINEQWPDYWAWFFEARGYVVLDVVRSRIWNEEKISVWYKQNALLYVKREKFAAMPKLAGSPACHPLCVVHPQLYLGRTPRSFVQGFDLFRRGIKASIKRAFGN